MFWRKKEPDKLRFQHYVVLRLSTNIPTILEKKAKENNYSQIYKDFMQLLASETFIMACMIGTCRPDIITGIFKQNDENYRQLTEVIRNGLTKIIAVREQKGEINLNDFARLFMKPEMGILPKNDPLKDLSIEVINSLNAPFLFGYTFGHDHPQRFLEILQKRFQEANKIGPNTFFMMGMLSIYGPLIEEDTCSFLLNTNGLDDIRLAYENGTLPEKLVSIYQNIASELVRNYELTIGQLN